MSGYGHERHWELRENMCDFLVETWQTNSNVAWALERCEIHWGGADVLPSPNADLYVSTKRTPAEHAGQTWKYAGVGEFLLCSMMLKRPIICVGPASDTNPQLMATVHLPQDTSEHVRFSYFNK